MHIFYKYPYLTTFILLSIIQTYIYTVLRKKFKWTFAMEQNDWWPFRWEIQSEDYSFFKKWVWSKGFYFLGCVDGLFYVWLEYTYEVVYRINKNFPALTAGMTFRSGIKLIFLLLFILMWLLWYRGIVHEYKKAYPWQEFYYDLSKSITVTNHILWAVIVYLSITVIWKSTRPGALGTIAWVIDMWVENMVVHELVDWPLAVMEWLYNYFYGK